MKIIYVEDCALPCKIIITDETLSRIKFFKDYLSNQIGLKENERVDVTIFNKLLKYDDDGKHKLEIKSDTCWIKISKGYITIEKSGWEGIEDLLDHTDNLLDLPDVYFTRYFLMYADDPLSEQQKPIFDVFIKDEILSEHQELFYTKLKEYKND